jgi:hypothetical protein
MNWTELCARASDSVALSQWLLDRALIAVSAARDHALDVAIAAALPTPVELCEALDAHAVRVPDEVVAKFIGHTASSPVHAQDVATISPCAGKRRVRRNELLLSDTAFEAHRLLRPGCEIAASACRAQPR